MGKTGAFIGRVLFSLVFIGAGARPPAATATDDCRLLGSVALHVE
jgi:hypothetical protein